MSRIREFETRTAALYRDGEIPGFVHVSVGQEAVAVGACSGLRDSDVITSTHRGHGHVLAKGASMPAMMAELMAKEDGSCRGRGGSMHIADMGVGVYGANGIVGAGLPIAVGAAQGFRHRGTDGVAVAFFGDGAVGQGAFHEAVNLAVALSLPVVFLCENNHFAEFSTSENVPVPGVQQRALGYGVRYHYADGNDVHAVLGAVTQAVEHARAGQGPVLLEADTYRVRGHYEGDPQAYRSDQERDAWLERDPLLVLRGRAMSSHGVDDSIFDEIDAHSRLEVDDAVEFARRSPLPDPATLTWFVTAAPQATSAPPLTEEREDGEIRTSRAIARALEHELEEDPDVFLAGIDVARGGGVFGITRGLLDRFPGRVIDTPISETAIMGLGVGSAMSGLRPVVELMYVDFIGVCLDQLLNQAAKMRFMTGGQASVPLTVRTQFGAGRASGSQHSQSLEALIAHIPGLKVVMPATTEDCYGLPRAAIRDPDPVVVIENRLLYEVKGPIPARGHLTPIGQAAVVRSGQHVTVVTMSRSLHLCLRAADELAAEGIECEVIDLRTVRPLDTATILSSFGRTNRAVVVHEAVTDFGIGAEIAAVLVDQGFWHLDAPVRRIGALPMPAPYAPNLEALWLPDLPRVVAAIRSVVEARP